MTTFDSKADILTDLWINYRTDEQFADFFEYSDIGLPLAYAYQGGLVELSPIAIKIVEETYSIFIESLGLQEQESELQGWTNLDQVFTYAEEFGWEKE